MLGSETAATATVAAAAGPDSTAFRGESERRWLTFYGAVLPLPLTLFFSTFLGIVY